MNASLYVIIYLLIFQICLVVTYVALCHMKLSHFLKECMFLASTFIKHMAMILYYWAKHFLFNAFAVFVPIYMLL